MTLAPSLSARAGEGVLALLRPLAILAAWLVLPLRSPRVRMLQAAWWPTRPHWIGVVAAVMLVAAAMVFLDAWAITAVRRLPVRLVEIFDALTDFGRSGWILYPVGGLLVALAFAAALARPRAQLALTAVAMRLWFLFVAVAIPGLLADLFKLIGRGRPFVTGKADPFAYAFPGWYYDYQSLPSGHATTAFAAAIAFGALWPRARPFLWVYAVLIAMSRVVLTVHHPSDVIAGALLGIVTSLLIRDWFAARRLVFAISPAGPVEARAMPSLWRIASARPPQAGPAGPTPHRDLMATVPQLAAGGGFAPARMAAAPPAVSVVIPVRNEGGNIAPLVAEIAAALAGEESFEVVFVNDGSTDTTAAELARLMPERPWLREIAHSRSCGQSASVRTGAEAARAPIVVTLDGDGQNDPAFIPDLLRALRAGAPRVGLVAGQRVGRKATRFKRLQSRVANAVRKAVLKDGTRDTGCGLKAFDRALFLRLPYFDGLHRFLPALVRREGFEIGYADVIDRERQHGVSKYGFWDRLWVGMLDLAGVWWLIRRRRHVPDAKEVR